MALFGGSRGGEVGGRGWFSTSATQVLWPRRINRPGGEGCASATDLAERSIAEGDAVAGLMQEVPGPSGGSDPKAIPRADSERGALPDRAADCPHVVGAEQRHSGENRGS